MEIDCNIAPERVDIKWDDWFYYDESSSSKLRWKVYRNHKAVQHSVAGTLRSDGYYSVRLFGKNYQVHRIVWEMHNHSIPEKYTIDHLDKDQSNNSITNLRCVTHKVNCRNRAKYKSNTTGVTGVFRSTYYDTRNGKNYLADNWTAYWIDSTGKQRSKSFSIKKFGHDMAFEMAVIARDAAITSMNQSGAGYT